jgi:hypothetical protein
VGAPILCPVRGLVPPRGPYGGKVIHTIRYESKK